MAVYKDKKTNKWYYEFSYKTVSGEMKRRKKRGFELKSEAKEAEAMERIRLKDAPPSTMTFGQLYNLYLEAKKPEWLPGTERKLRDHIELHVLPVFRDFVLDKITTKDIENWKIDMYNKTYVKSKSAKKAEQEEPQKYKAGTLNSIRRDFSSVFNYAINHRFITFNPVRAVIAFKDPQGNENQTEKPVWSPEEFNQFIDVVDNEAWMVFFSFLWVSGVRIGEAQGVMFKDIDFKNNTVTISRSIDTKQKGKAYCINPTKTKRTRVLELPVTYMDMLSPYYHRCKQMDSWRPDCFLFGFNKPLANTTIDKARERYIKLAGVKRISSHCFRHSHATYLLTSGIDIKSVSERLGHKDVKETLNTYAHVLRGNKSKILNLLDKSLKNCANFTPQE